MPNLFGVTYNPRADERAFLERVQTQSDATAELSVCVLSADESRTIFGVPLAHHGLQPVWVRVSNKTTGSMRLHMSSIDPHYFTPLEAAAICHFSILKRVAAFGLLAWFLLPLVVAILPFKLISARRANRRMDDFFQTVAYPLRNISPGGTSEGFVFTTYDAGTKAVNVCLRIGANRQDYAFSLPVPGLAADHLQSPHIMEEQHEYIDCDQEKLVARLRALPATTTNLRGNRTGDPVNLVIIGEFTHLLGAFAARWSETETITLASCLRTIKSFILGSEYRYSPVSALYLFGRPQDFALQRVRGTINERLHLRLWWTPMRFENRPVWVGQVSRDIGVRPTWRTWNLTTHRIDPNVDESRDYIIEDLFEAERIVGAGYVGGVGVSSKDNPRANLTGDPYYTDGRRVVIIASDTKTSPRVIYWE